MIVNNLIEALTRRGHMLGMHGISHEGQLLLNVDGRMMKCGDAEKLLRACSTEEIECNVVDILVSIRGWSAWEEPIHAVAAEFGWTSDEAKEFVRSLTVKRRVGQVVHCQLKPEFKI